MYRYFFDVFFPDWILKLPVWYSLCSFGYIFLLDLLHYFWYIYVFFFINLSRIFLSVIDVIKSDISNSVLTSRKSHSFSNWSSFSQCSSGVSLFVCSAQKNLRLSCICFFSVSSFCYIGFSLYIFILFGSVWYSDFVIWCIASGLNAHRKFCCIFSCLVFHSSVAVMFFSYVIAPISISYLRFAYCLNQSIHCR